MFGGYSVQSCPQCSASRVMLRMLWLPQHLTPSLVCVWCAHIPHYMKWHKTRNYRENFGSFAMANPFRAKTFILCVFLFLIFFLFTLKTVCRWVAFNFAWWVFFCVFTALTLHVVPMALQKHNILRWRHCSSVGRVVCSLAVRTNGMQLLRHLPCRWRRHINCVNFYSPVFCYFCFCFCFHCCWVWRYEARTKQQQLERLQENYGAETGEKLV